MKRFKSARHLQRLVSIHDVIATLFNFPRHSVSAIQYRTLRTEAMIAWKELAGMHPRLIATVTHAIAASKSHQRDNADNPDEVMVPAIAAEIAVRGIIEGWFGDKKPLFRRLNGASSPVIKNPLKLAR
jgi:hypothetical protein